MQQDFSVSLPTSCTAGLHWPLGNEAFNIVFCVRQHENQLRSDWQHWKNIAIPPFSSSHSISSFPIIRYIHLIASFLFASKGSPAFESCRVLCVPFPHSKPRAVHASGSSRCARTAPRNPCDSVPRHSALLSPPARGAVLTSCPGYSRQNWYIHFLAQINTLAITTIYDHFRFHCLETFIFLKCCMYAHESLCCNANDSEKALSSPCK